MGVRETDAYIEKSAGFAQPILNHVRALVHKACPETKEAMKWSMPFFTLDGKNLANMAAFKEHVAFGYWEALGIDTPKVDEAMGHYGRIRSLNDLPNDDELIAAIQSAVSKVKVGKRKAQPKSKPVTVPPVPDDFAKAIAANADARKTYDGFPPGSQRDYIEWITDAKRDATRQKRMVQAIEWMADGKDRNWKYR